MILYYSNYYKSGERNYEERNFSKKISAKNSLILHNFLVKRDEYVEIMRVRFPECSSLSLKSHRFKVVSSEIKVLLYFRL